MYKQYCFGWIVLVETNHKHLVNLFKKPLAEVPVHLQRMMMNLQLYDLDVQYIPGKYLFIVDTLSKTPVEASDNTVEIEEEKKK